MSLQTVEAQLPPEYEFVLNIAGYPVFRRPVDGELYLVWHNKPETGPPVVEAPSMFYYTEGPMNGARFIVRRKRWEALP